MSTSRMYLASEPIYQFDWVCDDGRGLNGVKPMQDAKTERPLGQACHDADEGQEVKIQVSYFEGTPNHHIQIEWWN